MDKQIVDWLAENGLAAQGETIPASLYKDIEFGHRLDPIIQCKTDPATSKAAKRGNWVAIEKALTALHFHLPPQTKTAIMNGHQHTIFKFLRGLYLRLKPNPDIGLAIESIDCKKLIKKTESCLEGITISLSRAFKTTPKQSLALLAQDNKMLTHLLIKGYKKEYEPVVQWLKIVEKDLEHMLGLAVSEGSLPILLSIIKPALLSRDPRVVEKSCKILGECFGFAIECGMRPAGC